MESKQRKLIKEIKNAITKLEIFKKGIRNVAKNIKRKMQEMERISGFKKLMSNAV